MLDFKGSGDVDVTTAGTPVQIIANQTLTPACVITAKLDNTNVIYVFGINQDKTEAAAVLSAGDNVEITAPQIRGTAEDFDLSRIYIDSEVDGEGVQVAYFIRRP